MSTSQSRSGGVTFLGLLTILFIGLRLTGNIDWSWWLVTLPLWGVLALCLVLFLLWIVFVGVVAACNAAFGPKKSRGLR